MQSHWDSIFRSKVSELSTVDPERFDPAHDITHFERVVALARQLGAAEGADENIVIPAAWLHDFIVVPKNDPRRSQASKLSAAAAIKFLREIDYPEKYDEGIGHAIETHSFSANLEPNTIEAKVVQDADRLDGIGAIGIARLFIVAGLMRRPIYKPEDPFCESRTADDSLYTIDHIYKKLFVVAESLTTAAGRAEGERRLKVLKTYLADLARELKVSKS